MTAKPEAYEFETHDLGVTDDKKREWLENVASQGNVLSRFAIYDALEKAGEGTNPLDPEDTSLKAVFNFAATHKALDWGFGKVGLLSRTGLAVTKIHVANMINFYHENPQYTDSHGDDFFSNFKDLADRLAKVTNPTHDAIDAYFFKAHAKLKDIGSKPGESSAPGAQKPPKIGNM